MGREEGKICIMELYHEKSMSCDSLNSNNVTIPS